MRLSILVLSLLATFPARAQTEGSPTVFIYADVAAGAGNPHTFKPTVSALFRRHHEISLGYASYWRRAKEIPGNYDNKGLFSDDVIYPQETFSALTFAYGYVLYPKRRPDVIRYVLRGGVALGHLSSPYNYVRSSGTLFGPTWTHETREGDAFAGTINPVMHYTPSKAFGLSAGLYAIFSSNFSGAGVTGSLLFGKVSNKAFNGTSQRKRKP